MTVVLHFWEHQFWRLRSSFRATLVAGATGPLFYLLGIGIGIGSQVDTAAAGLGTESYVDYVGPGLMIAAAMQLGATEGLWETAGSLRWRGTYIPVATTPMSFRQLFVGHVVWVGFRAVIGATAFLVALLAFRVPTEWTTPLAPFVAALTAMAFTAPISAWTAHVVSETSSEQSFPTILRLGIMPLYLFSGAFYPIEQLPAVLEWVSRVLPVWHGVVVARGLVIDAELSALATLGHLSVLVAYIVVGVLVGSRMFTKALGK